MCVCECVCVCVRPDRGSHWLEVLGSESEGIGIAKLSQDLPRGLVATSLDEQLV